LALSELNERATPQPNPDFDASGQSERPAISAILDHTESLELAGGEAM
jgi:hypothetical protein